MDRVLLCGCPRHAEGHQTFHFVLPIRADTFRQTVTRIRCRTMVREKTSTDNGECGQAIMLLATLNMEE